MIPNEWVCTWMWSIIFMLIGIVIGGLIFGGKKDDAK